MDHRDNLIKNLTCCLREISKSNSMLERNKEQNTKPASSHDVNSQLAPMTNTVCAPDLHISVEF